jgi:hypothetical protein
MPTMAINRSRASDRRAATGSHMVKAASNAIADIATKTAMTLSLSPK